MTNISTTRQLILQQALTSQQSPLDSDGWWLLGTTGCHLCDQAQQMLALFASVHPISLQLIDITDFEPKLMAQYATHIPVLISPKKQLNFPFSLVDLQQLI